MKMLWCLILSFQILSVSAQPQEKPKVVIGLVIDQMRWDYLYRYYNRYSENGFRRLLKEGYAFQNTMIPYSPTVTAAGHSSIYTGSVPAIHGIVGNDWVERESNTQVYCSSDKNVLSVGSPSRQGEMSPVSLLTTTVGDELRLASNFQSRVFGIALKDRSGIFAAGRSANAAYWFDDENAKWISSTWYMKALPDWVNQFNNRKLADSLMQKDWNTLYPIETYSNSTKDSSLFEKKLAHESFPVFPHSYKALIGKNYLGFRYSTFGNSYTFEFAKQLLVSESLGNMQTDMLCISLSSTDYVGHKYGVNSVEVEDMYLRLDQEIADFLSFLDKRYGNEYLLFLSADHGGNQSPAFMKENKLNAGSLHTWQLVAELNKQIADIAPANLVKAVVENQVYFNHLLIDSLHIPIQPIKERLIKYLSAKQQVMMVLDYNQPQQWYLPGKMKDAFINGYFKQRSGELHILLKPQYAEVNDFGTEHGSVYAYDTHIPLIFFGWKIPRGYTVRETYMTDIAPTISALLHIQMPNGCIGKPLPEVFTQQ